MSTASNTNQATSPRKQWLQSPRARVAAVLGFFILVLLTHYPFNDRAFSTDDYLQRVSLVGSAELAEKGFTQADPNRNLAQRLRDTFQFFSDQSGSLQAQRDYGNMSWWTVQDGMMQPFRPLAALTHWIDYKLWPNDRSMMQVHSLVYFVFFAFAALMLYQRLAPNWPIALLAASLIVFDYSMSLNFNWLAARNAYLSPAFGILCLLFYIRWREDEQVRYWHASIACFGAALLTAEAGLAIAGYLGAYALLMDRRGWLRGLVALWPFVVIVLVWRAVYSKLGFGASGIGLYLDPGRNLGDMLSQILEVFPTIVTSLATGFDALITAVDVQWRPWLVASCWAISLLGVYIIRNLLMESREARFLVLGSIFAAVPQCALLSAGARTGTFAAIGFFFVLALIIARLLSRGASRTRRVTGGALVAFHLVLPIIAMSVTEMHLLPTVSASASNYTAAPKANNLEDHSVVYITGESATRMYYLPYFWDAEGDELPKRMQVLAPGLSAVYLTRTCERTLELHSPAGFVLNQDSPLLQEDLEIAPGISKQNAIRMIDGLLTNPADEPHLGETYRNANMAVTVKEITFDGRVTKVSITMLGEEPLEKKYWQYFDWKKDRYEAVPAPVIGQTIYIPGPFDVHASAGADS
ncbi:Hypothetical protein HDN1F_15300 [gamma proteobacterium HdN1]|nr:Hypothetical protein HDN1F_15300 [gamma proteobacterium HdN1]